MTTDPQQNELIHAIKRETGIDELPPLSEVRLSSMHSSMLSEGFHHHYKELVNEHRLLLSVSDLLGTTSRVRQNVWLVDQPGYGLSLSAHAPTEKWVDAADRLGGLLANTKRLLSPFLDEMSAVTSGARVQKWHAPSWCDMLVGFATETVMCLESAGEADSNREDSGVFCEVGDWWYHCYYFQSSRPTTRDTWNQIAWGFVNEFQAVMDARSHRRLTRLQSFPGYPAVVAAAPDLAQWIDQELASVAHPPQKHAMPLVAFNPTAIKDLVDNHLSESLNVFATQVREVAEQGLNRYLKACKQKKKCEERQVMVRKHLYVNRDVESNGGGITIADVADATGLSTGWISTHSTAWRALMETRKQNKQGKPQKGRPAQSLTPEIEDNLGEADNALKELMDEHRADYEPSPLEPGNAKTVKAHKKV